MHNIFINRPLKRRYGVSFCLFIRPRGLFILVWVTFRWQIVLLYNQIIKICDIINSILYLLLGGNVEEIIKFINRKISDVNEKIEKNIEDSIDNRGYMSQNIIKSLRDLVEYISFKIYVIEKTKEYTEYNHENNGKAISYIKSVYKHSVLKNFHALLEIGPSHNSYSEDGSIRLMVKYQEYLIDLKKYYFEIFRENILINLYKFPIYNIDPSLVEYYKEIYNKIRDISLDKNSRVLGNIYYIKNVKLCQFGSMDVRR